MDDKVMTNKNTARRKDDPLVVELINQVRIKVSGSKEGAMNQDDFLSLQEDISILCKTNIDDRTLKEYFGYYQKRTDRCSPNILNAFAVYLGFKNFNDFKKGSNHNLIKNDDEVLHSKLKNSPNAEEKNIVEKKKGKIILSIVAIIVFSGLFLFILFNRKSVEKNSTKTEQTEEAKIIAQDSIPHKKENEEWNKIKERENGKTSVAKAEIIEPAKKNTEYLNDLNTKFDIALLIINDKEQPENELSSQIATLYRNQGYSVTYSLFSKSFIQSEYLTELQNARRQVIDTLNLGSLIKTIIVGKVSYTFHTGTLEPGTIVCNARINVNIISASQKSLINSFSFSVNGNGVSDLQAKEHAFTKLFNKFKDEYPSL